ncbi:MAG: VanZ family protein [Coriobacteriales bacterium]|jgi:VanZ family protein|nr:VanZ family protein [Coriobacteriales bacterium]
MCANDLREKPKKTPRLIAGVFALLWAALIFFLSSIEGGDYPPHPGFLNYVAHFCEYLVFGTLLTVALNGPTRALWKSALIALVVASVYAVSDEFHQFFVPGRQCDPIDWLTDTIGAAVGCLATIFYLSARKASHSRRRDGVS